MKKTIEEKKDDSLNSMHETLLHGRQQKKKQKAYRKPAHYFKNVHYDEEGKYLILHHYGAEKYYRMNVAVLFLFLGVTLYNYVYNPQVFYGSETVANIYLFAI